MRADVGMRDYRPPGPVAAAFLADQKSFVRAIMGPQGSGKTNAVIADIIANAKRMPTCLDGTKRYRHLVVRDTYQNMNRSFLASWFTWFAKTDGKWTGGGDRPACHKIQFKITESGRPVMLDFEMHFTAIGDHRAEDVLRGYEITAATLNEGDLMSPNVLDYLVGRTGRWPAMRMLLTRAELDGIERRLGRPAERTEDLPERARYRDYITMDFNAPDIENYTYDRFVENRPINFAFYRQPSGFSPQAENMRNLKPGYYRQQAEANAHRPWWIRRMIENEFGYMRDGEPVHPEFKDHVHMAQEPFGFAPNIPIRIGLDAGGHPGAVLTQWMPDGQWRIPYELYLGRCGAKWFAERLRNLLQQEAPGATILPMFVDPTAFYGADEKSDELAWAQIVESIMQVRVQPAPSNEYELRFQAVRDELVYRIDGEKPALLISPVCKLLRRGFSFAYRFANRKLNDTYTKPEPEKGDESHVMEALQYVLLGTKGKKAIISGERGVVPTAAGMRRSRPGLPTGGNAVIKADFDVFGGR